MTAPKNLIVIMSDEHSAKTLGCYGHSIASTPNLDRLAASGTLFTNAYCNSPVCVPARAVFATGTYVHQNGFWDNADPYDGTIPTWHHRLRDAGMHVVSFGKLHFRDPHDDNGFSQEIIPMHVVEGKGDLMSLLRDELPRRAASYKMAEFAGAGESSYTTYDRAIVAHAQTWLHEQASCYADRPWALFVSFVAPHFPLTAPPEHFYRYYRDPALRMPKLYDVADRPNDPYLREYGASFAYDEHFDSADRVRRAVSGYLGLCSFLDENVGKIMDALRASGHADDTRIIYTSDHGDNLGARGVWGKSTMYEESVAVPLIMAGPGIAAGQVCTTAVSHVDAFPTILEAAGVQPEAADRALPGRSLFAVAAGADAARPAFSEYHGMGSVTGTFMVRHGRWKYIHSVAYDPLLFDLSADPEELTNCAADPACAGALADCRAVLQGICDPATVDAAAKTRQAAQLALNGGRAAVIARGDLGFSPPPGTEVSFS